MIAEAELGPASQVQSGSTQESDVAQACANLIADMDVTSQSHVQSQPTSTNVVQLLKDLQPHKEKPSKDRSRRFAVGEIVCDAKLPTDHDLREYQYWAIHPANKAVRCAKCFLVGQVIYMSHLGKHCRTSLSTNLNIQVMMNVYEYTAENVQCSKGKEQNF